MTVYSVMTQEMVWSQMMIESKINKTIYIISFTGISQKKKRFYDDLIMEITYFATELASGPECKIIQYFRQTPMVQNISDTVLMMPLYCPVTRCHD